MENGKKKSSNKKMVFAIVGELIVVFCLCIVVAAIVSPSTPSAPSPSTLPETNQPEPIQVSSPVPTATEIKSSRCVPASNEQLEAIRAGIKDIAQGNDIKSGWAVKSNDFEKVWFVAVKIYGAGMENGTGPGLWAISGEPNSPGLILSVDGFAKEFSPYPDASKTDAAITISDDGAQDALLCANND